jgi:hypothetical protein
MEQKMSPRPLLPSVSTTGLAFTPESVSSWTSTGDLLRFLSDGILLGSTNNHYALSLFEDGRKRFLNEAREFRENALRSPDSLAQVQHAAPHFENDPTFGLMAKYAAAFDGVLNAMLSDGAFGSLPHILEVDSDLTCSVMLASNMYYKQALQALRGVLELSVAQVHFVTHPEDFLGWVDGTWRPPTMRGRKRDGGWLANLKAEGALSGNLDQEIGDLYGELNGTVHASEVRFVHSGLPKGRWAGHQFKRQQFDDWCLLFGRTVSSTFRLFAQMLANEETAPKPDGIVCNVCQQVNNFDVISRNQQSVRLKCRVCSAEHEFLAEYGQKFGY